MKNFILLFALLFSISITAQENADAVVKQALETAVKQDKKVLVMFHASWCGWCKKMDANMSDPRVKAYFEDSFVITHITVQETPKNKTLENPGGKEIMDSYGGQYAGLPFWAILDNSGDVLTNANDENGDNLGCPATPEEVAAFIKKLKEHTAIDTKTINEVVAVFSK
jgi:thiol-disulfide isomerase/thioredoxin